VDLALRRPSLDDVFLSLTGHAADGDPNPDPNGTATTEAATEATTEAEVHA
ncbi:MAG TPA: daunorubicin/doxorubicin resistance ABC transporter ATP-binding protein DrrA, partial [Acidimicrobiia bacterium]